MGRERPRLRGRLRLPVVHGIVGVQRQGVTRVTVSLIAVAASLLSLVVFALCASDVIPPNRLIGIRTNATLRSRPAWRSVHRHALLPMGVTTVVVGGCWLLEPAGIVDAEASAALGFLVLIAGLLWAWAHGVRRPPLAKTG